MKHLFLSVIVFPLTLFGQQKSQVLTGKYVGFCARTQWHFTFKNDNTYLFETIGHFGNTNTVGQYNISSDTVFLKPYPIEQQKSKFYYHYIDTLLIDGDSCLIHASLRYDYCKRKNGDRFFHSSRKRPEAKKPDSE